MSYIAKNNGITICTSKNLIFPIYKFFIILQSPMLTVVNSEYKGSNIKLKLLFPK